MTLHLPPAFVPCSRQYGKARCRKGNRPKDAKKEVPHEITTESECNSRRESKSLEHRTVTTLAPHGSRPLKRQEEVYEMGASIAVMEEGIVIWTFRLF